MLQLLDSAERSLGFWGAGVPGSVARPHPITAMRPRGSLDHTAPYLVWHPGESEGKAWCSGVPALFVGGAHCALEWAARHWAVVINCSDIDYPFAPTCQRLWLNLNFKGWLNGRSWHQRVLGCLQSILEALREGRPVLCHCRVGKHRSGAFAALAIALISDMKYTQALNQYFRYRPLTASDRQRCASINDQHDFEAILTAARDNPKNAALIGAIFDEQFGAGSSPGSGDLRAPQTPPQGPTDSSPGSGVVKLEAPQTPPQGPSEEQRRQLRRRRFGLPSPPLPSSEPRPRTRSPLRPKPPQKPPPWPPQRSAPPSGSGVSGPASKSAPVASPWPPQRSARST